MGGGGGVQKKRKEGNERKGKEKRKREKKEKKGKRKEIEKDEGGRLFLPQFIGIPKVETLGPRSKVRRFDEGLRFKRCRVDIGGRRSNEVVIVKKADMWP